MRIFTRAQAVRVPPRAPNMLPLSEADDERWMGEALEEARRALRENEVPVGCVFVDAAPSSDAAVIARGHNVTNQARDATRHAELVAIDRLLLGGGARPPPPPGEGAAPTPGGARAVDWARCCLYVTCEPCIMCSAALSRLGVGRVVYGCANERFGGAGSILALHEPSADGRGADGGGRAGCGARELGYACVAGVMAEPAVELFRRFYARENARAPEAKRKRKAGADADADADADAASSEPPGDESNESDATTAAAGPSAVS